MAAAAPDQAAVINLPAHLIEHENDENAFQKGYIKGTDYSLPYASRWSRLPKGRIDKELLRHMNCGYLSTHKTPPTLLALKQHAQSLCYLIKLLTPDLESKEILTIDPTNDEEVQAEEARRRQLEEDRRARIAAGEDVPVLANPRQDEKDALIADPEAVRARAFDFLADITKPYANSDPNHHKPLVGMMNEVRARHEAYGTNYNCPFAEHVPRVAGEPTRAFENHHLLIMHANSCLERIDHEFAATGGLLSVLPTTGEHERDQFSAAKNSLLGQWILFTQHLVARMHELERCYANALDALAGEAAIPAQHLSTVGPDGRAEREMVFPQDRWVLANAGDDVFNNLHDLFDKQEALAQAKEKVWKAHGAVGEQYWIEQRGGQEYARGLVSVTLQTKYYRIAGQGRGTIFVLPASEIHPGTTYTKELEDKPTVVGMANPKWPTKVSDLEARYEERLERALQIEQDNRRLAEDAEKRDKEIGALRETNDKLIKERDSLINALYGRINRRKSGSGPST